MTDQKKIEAFKFFVMLVSDMRKAQRNYFKERTQDRLKDSIHLEREVDNLLMVLGLVE
jgi:hypothetical protein